MDRNCFWPPCRIVSKDIVDMDVKNILHIVMQTLHANSETQMTVHEKRAWINMAVFALTLGIFLIALYFGGFRRSLGTLGFLGLLVLNPYTWCSSYLYRRSKKSPSGMLMDERDISIQQKSKFIALQAIFAVFVFVWAALWATDRLHDMISIDRVMALPLAGLFLFILVESIATLVQYTQGK